MSEKELLDEIVKIFALNKLPMREVQDIIREAFSEVRNED